MNDDDERSPDREEADPKAVLTDFVRRARASSDPRARLLEPLSDERRAAIAARVLGASSGPARVVPLRPAKKASPRRWLAVAFAATLAAAAVIAIVLRRPPPPEPVAYTFQARSGSAVRASSPGAASSPEGVLVVTPSSTLTLTLTPRSPVEGRVLSAAIVERDRVRRWTPGAIASPGGGFEIHAPAAEIAAAGARGALDLVLVLSEKAPSDDEIERWVRAPSVEAAPGVAIFHQPVWIVGDEHAAMFAGCTAVLAGRVCEHEAGATLRIWMPVPPNAVSVRIDGREEVASRVGERTGTRLAVKLPAGAKRLETRSSDGAIGIDLELRPALGDAALAKAETLRQRRELDEAEKVLDEIDRSGSDAAKLQALRLRARVAWARGDHARADALRSDAVQRARAEGRLSDEVDDTLTRVFGWVFVTRDFEAAKAALEGLRDKLADYPEGRVSFAYYEGLLANEIGDLRGALAHLEAARSGAERLAMADIADAVRVPLADVLATLGRGDEAAAVLRGAQGDEQDPCHRADRKTSEGWIALRTGRLAAARETLEAAVEVAQKGCPGALAASRLNLAFLEAEQGHVEAARTLLRQSPAPTLSQRLRAWRRRLELRLSLAGSPAEALAAAGDVERAGIEAGSPEMLFEAASGRARAFEALGRTDDARAAHAAASAELDAWARLVPLGEGRDTFLAQQERASRAQIALLIAEAERAAPGPARDRAARDLAAAARRSMARPYRTLSPLDLPLAAPGGALDVASYRRAQAHVEAAIAEGKAAGEADRSVVAAALARARAARSEELPPPPPGELFLLFHATPDGWVTIAEAAGGAVAWSARKDGEPRNETTLLEPFRAQIEGAQRIRLLRDRSFRDAPLHALTWNGRPLFLHAPVAYGTEGLSPIAAGEARGRYAVVVSDPKEDLAGARATGEDVAGSLAKRGFRVVRLAGKDARRATLLALLESADVALFHYDGHGRFEGRDGTAAALDLADGPLTALDLLALARVPPHVVLSGCDTGREEGAGLALAFLDRGARQVIAATAPVRDEAAAAIARGLYADAAFPASGEVDLAAGLRSAAAGGLAEQAVLFRAFVR